MLMTYPLDPPPRKAFHKRAFESFMVAFCLHGIFGIAIYSHVIATRFLATSNAHGLVVSAVTGIFFPAVTWIIRKIVIKWIFSYSEKAASEGETDHFLYLYQKFIRGASVALMITPSVLLYLNTSFSNALLSACFQLITEAVGPA